MDDKILERMLDNLIEEAGPIAIKNMESKQEEISDVQFSKEHEEKMKKIFAEARKELEVKGSKEISEANESSKENLSKKKPIVKFKKIVLIAAVLVLVLGLMTSASRMERKFFEILYGYKG